MGFPKPMASPKKQDFSIMSRALVLSGADTPRQQLFNNAQLCEYNKQGNYHFNADSLKMRKPLIMSPTLFISDINHLADRDEHHSSQNKNQLFNASPPSDVDLRAYECIESPPGAVQPVSCKPIFKVIRNAAPNRKANGFKPLASSSGQAGRSMSDLLTIQGYQQVGNGANTHYQGLQTTSKFVGKQDGALSHILAFQDLSIDRGPFQELRGQNPCALAGSMALSSHLLKTRIGQTSEQHHIQTPQSSLGPISRNGNPDLGHPSRDFALSNMEAAENRYALQRTLLLRREEYRKKRSHEFRVKRQKFRMELALRLASKLPLNATQLPTSLLVQIKQKNVNRSAAAKKRVRDMNGKFQGINDETIVILKE
ncbi:hypothetical protein FGO68_gene13263 [Halteria grandinella]|uniref:Uncharacterized protein n=1 Tax=Halteria grandinella TaxID=5974 RepID=A0A8J8NS20_HALGN|nr:hypothetical protein FGO68_gene13263 [Halteria grandinella]